MQPHTPDINYFPPVELALREPNGLLAMGGDLTPERLLAGYRQGIFPWFSPGDPILWWSPDPRMILIPSELHISHSLTKTLRKNTFTVRTNTAFEQTVRACAAPRAGTNGTWIVDDMIAAYCELHRLGYAHSVETWQNDELVGGLYGVALGRVFFGESMFSRRTDASKFALAQLSRQLQKWDFGLIDCQMHTPHLASLGAREIARADFVSRVRELVNCAPVSDWHFESAPHP
jgi:leucyl/phenylalanyl-tRNA--protein transferase